MSSAILTLAIIWLQAAGVLGLPASAQFNSNCEAAYKLLSSTHTMCLTNGPGTPLTVDKTAVTDYHNLKRSLETSATDLVKVYWDPEVARVASHWAAQCGRYGSHDSTRSVPTLPGIYIGQNMAAGYSTFEKAIDGWYSEKNHFRFNQGSTNGKAVGHYTQVVSNNVYRIGCGRAMCPGNTNYYICNYVTGWHSNAPYTWGQQCSACPNSCSKGLCDCQDLMCLNAGTLDKGSCTCQCQPNVKGRDCSEVVCRETNPDWRCSRMPASSCNSKWSGTNNYIKYLCPEMCGLCNKAQAPPATGTGGNSNSGGSTQNPGSGSTSGSSNTGPSSGGSGTGSQNPGGAGSSTSGQNSGGSNQTPSSGAGSSCQDNWVCARISASRCQPRSYVNGKLVLDQCPRLCNKCGSQGSSGGSGNSNVPSSGGSSGSGGGSSGVGSNSQSGSGSCEDNWACSFTTAAQCTPNNYLNGKTVPDLCPSLCGKCGSNSNREAPEAASSSSSQCEDELVCVFVSSNNCHPYMKINGKSIPQACPKLCNQC